MHKYFRFGVFVLLGSVALLSGTFLVSSQRVAFAQSTLNAASISPVSGTTLSSTQTFSWSPVTGAVQYWIYFGTSQYAKNIANQEAKLNTATSKIETTVNGIPQDGKPVYLTVWYKNSDNVWGYYDVTYSTQNTGAGSVRVTSLTPAAGATLDSTQKFSWSPVSGATSYWIYFGKTQYGKDIANQEAKLNTATSKIETTVNGIPQDGKTVYLTVWYVLNGEWKYEDFQFGTKVGTSTGITNLSPGPGSVLGPAVTFTWSGVPGATRYHVYFGKSRYAKDVGEKDLGTQTSVSFTNVPQTPAGGQPVYAYLTIWYYVNGQWKYEDFQFGTKVGAPTGVTNFSPTFGTTLGTSQKFSWNPISGATSYWIYFGKTQYGKDIASQEAKLNTATSKIETTVNGILQDGKTVHLTVWYLLNGEWKYEAFQFPTHDACATGGIQCPRTSIIEINPPLSYPLGPSVGLNWNPVIGATGYHVYVGKIRYGTDIFNGPATSTLLHVSGIPQTGAPVYVTIWYNVNGQWKYNDFTYTTQN